MSEIRICFCGHQNGLFVRYPAVMDRFMSGLPTVRVDDILVHPRRTTSSSVRMGRGIFIIDDITPLQQLTSSKVLDTETHLFEYGPEVWLNDVRLIRFPNGARTFSRS